MAGYLANYGIGDEQRAKVIRRLIIIAIVVLVAAGATVYGVPARATLTRRKLN